MAAMPQGANLDQLGVPQELRDRAKMMWILFIFLGLWSWVLCAFLWKVDGQEQNQWFQFQLKQNLYASILSVIAWAFGLGGLVQLVYGFLGFSAIGKGEDFEGPVIGGMARK